MKNIVKVFLLAGFVGLASTSFTACSLDSIDSNTKDNEKFPIKSVEELAASLNGSYARMAAETYYGRDIIAFSESRSSYMYSTDETGRFGSISGFTILPTHAYSLDTWGQVYRVISNTNRVIEADIEENNTVKYYKGQAYVLRAIAHYDLVRLYGEQYVGGLGLNALGVPYKTSFLDIDEKISRPTVRENQKSILADLEKGIKMMTEAEKAIGVGSRVRLNVASAYGFKSRIALFFSKYDASMLNVVVESSAKVMELAPSSNVAVMSRSSFLDAYKGDGIMSNSLFELAQSGTDNLSTNSLFYIYSLDGYGDLVCMEDSVIDIFPELEGDLSVDDIRSEIVGLDEDEDNIRNLGKYTVRTSNIRVMRIEEIMMNYIEATLKGASNGNNALALDYLNAIVSQRVTLQKPQVGTEVRPSAVAKKYTTLTFEDYKKERVRELMFEGFAYEDIMRWGGEVSNPKSEVNKLLSNGKVVFGDKFAAFPIPQSEINVSKIEQNQAYK
ncbi:RagB/SusD family nutrient uptake outer membrane protein [Myroides sp. M-43]|uniref:RagB/SusD family nutrient uptake outer membrane protein n=1 Tax=Myroides oncorhynchi TaxID=2893756 RepID=UPI001E312451|nr:RagB/SusD family nutrient uptake outer membrane protein [Myroides oncorhynchi]MCC9041740.1 RagB/SusD family nutrient uptake outer membrane protein [Myroides oncorhynchi]